MKGSILCLCDLVLYLNQPLIQPLAQARGYGHKYLDGWNIILYLPCPVYRYDRYPAWGDFERR